MSVREKRIKKCQRCGKKFGCPYGIGFGVWRKRKYCSQECANPSTTVTRYKVCLTCGEKFYCQKGLCISEWKKRKFCCQKCSRHLGMFKKGQKPWNKGKSAPWATGKNHWQWKGGFNGVQNVRWCPEYGKWRNAVFKKDRYICQKCGNRYTKRNPIHAHHIVKFSVSKEKMFDLKNGITLCKKCHLKEHCAL